MSDVQQLARDFMAALGSTEPGRYEAVLTEEVGLRLIAGMAAKCIARDRA